MNRVSDTGILSDQVCSHSLSHRGHEGVSNQCGLQVDQLLPPGGLLIHIPLVNGRCQLRQVFPSIALSRDEEVPRLVLRILSVNEFDEEVDYLIADLLHGCRVRVSVRESHVHWLIQVQHISLIDPGAEAIAWEGDDEIVGGGTILGYSDGSILCEQAEHRGGSGTAIYPQDQGSRLVSVLEQPVEQVVVVLLGGRECAAVHAREWICVIPVRQTRHSLGAVVAWLLSQRRRY